MNVEEKVAALEALLARVQKNAAKPRILRPVAALEPNGNARLAQLEPRPVEPVVAAPPAPIEKIEPVRAEAPTPLDAIDAHLEKVLGHTIEKPVEARVEKPV